jgi:amino acid transporter
MLPRNTRKALTPIATIITLLCVAISVTLATVAWINGLPTSNMYTEDLQATNHQWGPNCTYVDVTLHNNGTRCVKLKSATVNSQPATAVYIVGSNQINSGETTVIRVANTFIVGTTYQLAFQTAKGNKVIYNATAELVSPISRSPAYTSDLPRTTHPLLNSNPLLEGNS